VNKVIFIFLKVVPLNFDKKYFFKNIYFSILDVVVDVVVNVVKKYKRVVNVVPKKHD
jgi:hypothetical protein